MPRGIGVGHADTVQQRARFYGYNRRYLGFCRVYLENDAREAYQHYIDHEDQLRVSLANHASAGRPLNEWKRAFFLDTSLKPTRDNVLDIDYTRGPDADFPYDAMPPLYSQDDLTENRALVSSFTAGMTFVPDTDDPRRTAAQKHEVNRNVRLRDAFDRLLVPLRINDPADSWKLLQVRLQIQRYLESHPDAICSVYRMKPGFPEYKRGLTDIGRINPFQGANPGTGYPGDDAIFDRGVVTIQIFQIARVEKSAHDAGLVAADVPLVAVVLPTEVATGMVVQRQGDWR